MKFYDTNSTKIDGITYIVHPNVTAYKGTATYDRVVAFTMEGMVWNQFDPMEQFLDRNPDAKFNFQAYMQAFVNGVRVDDKRVVWMDIDVTP